MGKINTVTSIAYVTFCENDDSMSSVSVHFGESNDLKCIISITVGEDDDFMPSALYEVFGEKKKKKHDALGVSCM